MQEYNKALKIIEKYVDPNKPTNTGQLNHLGSMLFGHKFAGTYAKNEIKDYKIGKYYIINTDLVSQKGEHWLGIASDTGIREPSFLVYDSFGRDSKDILGQYIPEDSIDTEHDLEQAIEEKNCGLRCLAWLWVFDRYGWDAAETV
jgi:hypothetical protein